uniref:Uncharacterized protein n=1 Tax=mine drainage metagenome TaxID=410659 RepID=E6QJT2_9ZZZZ
MKSPRNVLFKPSLAVSQIRLRVFLLELQLPYILCIFPSLGTNLKLALQLTSESLITHVIERLSIASFAFSRFALALQHVFERSGH